MAPTPATVAHHKPLVPQATKAQLERFIKLIEAAHAEGKRSVTLLDETEDFNLFTMPVQEAFKRNGFKVSYSYDSMGEYAASTTISW